MLCSSLIAKNIGTRESSLKFKSRAKKRFIEIVDKLSQKNAWRLLTMVGDSPGVIPKLNKKWREKRIVELQNLVEDAHRRELRKWVRRNPDKHQVIFTRRIEKNDKGVHVREHLAR